MIERLMEAELAMPTQIIPQNLSLSPSSPPQRRSWSFFDITDYLVRDCGACLVAMEEVKSGNFRTPESLKHPCTKKPRRNVTREKSPGTMTEVLEQQIWKDFPEDLLEAVIARLPIATIFRFRTVCRQWNSLLTSQSFSEHCAQVPQAANPWFYTIPHDFAASEAMYDPSMEKWYHLTLSKLHTMLSFLPVASAGGLVCFLDADANIYVCNPLTQSFKELPAPSIKIGNFAAVRMITYGNSTSAGYRILWVGFDGRYEIYDSVRKSWSCSSNLPAGIKVPLLLNFRSQGVSIDSTVYFLHLNPKGIVSYDMETGVWKQYIIPAPLHMTDHILAECDGRIMLVGLLTKNAATCVCIWELQKMTLLWKEVDRMPNVLCLDFYGKDVSMICLGSKGLIMLSLRSSRMNRLVTYNIASREWRKVPWCVMPRYGRKHQRIAWGFAFHPSLTAVP